MNVSDSFSKENKSNMFNCSQKSMLRKLLA